MPRILIVDDDPNIRANTARLLSARGHEVAQAASTDEALACVDATAVDLVIMDVVMPVKGGIEAIMEIHSRHPEVPAIIMSGKVPLGTDAVDGLMKRYGSKAVLSKPFTAEELLTAVETALSPSP